MRAHRHPLSTLVRACKGANISMSHLAGLAALANPPSPNMESLVRVW